MKDRLDVHQAALVMRVSTHTIYRWQRNGWITRYLNGYELDELEEAEARRDSAALCVRAGVPRHARPGV